MPYQHPHPAQPQQPQLKNLFGEDSRGLVLKKFQVYEYIQCVCEGKKNMEGYPSFRCTMCEYRYHYSCLKIEKATKEEVICPICNLRK